MSKKDFDDLKELGELKGQHFSRTKFNYCKNDDCYNKRRDVSAYCQECSDKYNK